MLVFGFFHGFGLATKLQEFALSPNGLVANIVSFNVGVEIGQGLALTAHPDRAQLLAHAQRVSAPRVRHQRRRHGGRLPADGLPAVRLLPGAVIMSQTVIVATDTADASRRSAPSLAVAAGAALLVAGTGAGDVRAAGGIRRRSARHGRAVGLLDLGVTGQQVEALESAGGIGPDRQAADRRPAGARVPARKPWSSRSRPARAWNTSTASTRAKRCSTRGRRPAPSTVEFHAEPDGGPRGYAQTYEKSAGRSEASGTLTAPFLRHPRLVLGEHGQSGGHRDADRAGYYNLSHEFRTGQPVKNKMFQ